MAVSREQSIRIVAGDVVAAVTGHGAREVATGKLRFDERRILGEEQDASTRA
jgi:hypothetical protein